MQIDTHLSKPTLYRTYMQFQVNDSTHTHAHARLVRTQANWMFDLKHYNRSTNNFTFGKGGNQGARGNNYGGDFFVQDVCAWIWCLR